MKVIEFDGRDFKDIECTHGIIKSKLDLPEYYGNNLDALWDCLTGWVDVPILIKWNNYNESYNHLGSYAKELMSVFEDASNEVEELTFELEV